MSRKTTAAQPPWKRPRPGGKAKSKKKLSAQQVAAARARAQKAGRRYPNLVDNMWAARLKPEDLRAPPPRDSYGPD